MVGGGKIWIFPMLLLGCVSIGAQYENCTGVIEWIADGYCNSENNYEACAFDGGDCCECTCGSDLSFLTCDYMNFDCLDPNANGAMYNCEEPPADAIPCAADLPSQWSVETTSDAQDLAEAVYCSGGVFEVIWNGIVGINETIYVVDGTVLNISGVGSDDAIDGGGINRAFAVRNASLHVSDMDIINGSATSGGAIAASGSALTFTRTNFFGNTASIHGGGMLVTDRSSVVFNGETIFSGNAAVSGGAMVVKSGSNISWEGETDFSLNKAYGDGGALHVWDSFVSWAGNTSFSSNAANSDGGAAYLLNSTASWVGKASLFGNTASESGGAIFMSGSTTSWTGKTTFFNNTAIRDGGALYVSKTTASWAGEAPVSNISANQRDALRGDFDSIPRWSECTIFAQNTASNGSGGAVYIEFKSNAVWWDDTIFFKNSATDHGGAVASYDSTLSWAANSSFSSNAANIDGGALFLWATIASWAGETRLSNNAATRGGALYEAYSIARWSGYTTFTQNAATNSRGGAVYVDFNTTTVWSGDTVFSKNNATEGGAVATYGSIVSWVANASFFSNTASVHGGAIILVQSTVSWTGNTTFSDNIASIDGGALFLWETTASWSGETLLSNNAATRGGALYEAYSIARWSGDTTFTQNTANNSRGGAAYVDVSSITVWSGDTVFSKNIATEGGAVATYDSTVSWADNASFFSNTATVHGGAIYSSESIVSWAGNTIFADNIASLDGGALYVWGGTASWAGKTRLSYNTATRGGALYEAYSNARWSGDTTFTQNTATNGGGGAAYVDFSSAIVWSGDTVFSKNNATHQGGAVATHESNVSWVDRASFFGNTASGGSGGAVYVQSYGNALWSGNTIFLKNNATDHGGAVAGSDNTLSWAGNTVFSGNAANIDGGALYVWGGTASWAGETHLANNAAKRGGALYEAYGNAKWSGDTTFTQNTATNGGGGAAYVDFRSTIIWSGDTVFSKNNAAHHGGAIAAYDSTASWVDKASFFNNTATLHGGAFFVLSSHFSWSAETLFSDNVADGGSGGAVMVAGASSLIWTGNTWFLLNKAGSDGGALVFAPNESESFLLIGGTTKFQNNTCEGYGGGIRISNMVSVAFNATDILFWGNTATLSGGGISILAADLGPVFKGVSFIMNSAQVGGGVHITDTPAPDDYEGSQPTTFDGCIFVANVAQISGGAVSSDSGLDTFVNTSFVSNQAQAGGALHLAGTASLYGCSFEENVSNEEGGPAVFNLKAISQHRSSLFSRNGFRCDSGAFLQFTESEDVFGTVCAGCPEPCDECNFDTFAPKCVTLSTAGIVHASSSGGGTTIEGIVIEEGYWRATNTSTAVLKCYNQDACPGGMIIGKCNPGYEGPYCSVCAQNYVASPGYECIGCSNITGIVVIVIFAVVCMIVGVALIFHLMSGEEGGTGKGLVDRVTRFIPLHPLKIIIVSWQILTQFTAVANVTYPDVYQRFLNGVDILNFDLGWVLSTGCLIKVDYHDRLLISTIGPIVAIMVLGGTYAVAVSRDHGREQARQNIRHKHMSIVLLVTFLVYASVSSVAFQMFDCEYLDDGKHYLRADYRIYCDSAKHQLLQVYAGIMIALYPVGIPVLYAILLFRERSILTDEDRRVNDPSVQSTSDLWTPYKPSCFFYEIVECGRRILLTSVVLVIDDEAAAKIAVTFMISLFFVFFSEALAPYKSRTDTWISRAGHAVTCTSIFFALLLEVDISEENQASQRAFEVVLVAAHACMILAVIIEGGLAVYSSLKPTECNVPVPRFRSTNSGTAPVNGFDLNLTTQGSGSSRSP